MEYIRNIWCVGRNFAEHAKELKNPIPKQPLFFLKAGSCALSPGQPIVLPTFSKQIEYELEIALQFNEHLKIERACLALDLTARDLQTAAKAQNLPWTLSKSFPGSCPLGPFFHLPSLEEPLLFELFVGDHLRQKGNTQEMIFPFKALAAYCLAHFPVCPGDLLLTGTPSGVSQARPGDQVRALIPKISESRWNVL